MDLLLPVVVLAVPVLAVVVIAVATGRNLRPSCGGIGVDGRCSRCGKSVGELDRLPQRGSGSACP